MNSNIESKHKKGGIMAYAMVFLCLSIIFCGLAYMYGSQEAINECNEFYSQPDVIEQNAVANGYTILKSQDLKPIGYPNITFRGS